MCMANNHTWPPWEGKGRWGVFYMADTPLKSLFCLAKESSDQDTPVSHPVA